MSFSFSSPPWSYESTSPYPPSSASSSDFEYDQESTHSTAYLHSSIAILSEAKLRNLMLKLANRDPHFQRAIIKELSRNETELPPTLPTTPTPAKQRKWHRKSRRNVKNLSISTKICAQLHHEIEYTYHPGRLEEEAYEFISVLPDKTHVVRKVTMWSCCDEDEWSPGCISAPAAAFPLHLQDRMN